MTRITGMFFDVSQHSSLKSDLRRAPGICDVESHRVEGVGSIDCLLVE